MQLWRNGWNGMDVIMDYEFYIGNKKTAIYDPCGFIKLNYDFFSPLQDCFTDYTCSIQPLQRCCEKKLLSFFYEQTKRKININGFYNGKYTSVLTNRNIYILTSIERRHIEVYCNEDSINEKSMYMFFCELKKHVIRLIFADKLIPLHASCVYNKKKNIAILITGESNSGKSSTCWNLRQLGFECVADDIILYYDNHIHTAIEYLYITDDFKERFQINNSELVCAGRKHRIKVPKQINSIPACNCSIIITCGVNNQKRTEKLTNRESVALTIDAIHRQWTKNYDEYLAFRTATARMVSEADTAFQLYLGDSTAYGLSEIITEISKSKPNGRTTR